MRVVVPSIALVGFVAATCIAAAARAGEPGLEGRDDIYMQTSFELEDWFRKWGRSEPPRNTRVVEGDGAFRGDRLLRVSVDGGEHYGTGFSFMFADETGSEPEEVYFRYAIRFGPNWVADRNGKLPGFAGTYGVAGWGGRPADGADGWSARMTFAEPETGADQGRTKIGYYTYHADMTGMYGDSWYFSGGPLGPGETLPRGEWHQVEGYVKMNDPNGDAETEGANNGILRAWVDGTKVLEKTDLRFRDAPYLKVERIWFNIYYGGSWTAPQDVTIDFDNVVIAENYIGPVADESPGSADAGDSGVADPGDAGDWDSGGAIESDGGAPAGDESDGGTGGKDRAVDAASDLEGSGDSSGGSSTGGGGCNCAAPGQSSPPVAPLVFGAAMLAVRLRRRRLHRTPR